MTCICTSPYLTSHRLNLSMSCHTGTATESNQIRLHSTKSTYIIWWLTLTLTDSTTRTTGPRYLAFQTLRCGPQCSWSSVITHWTPWKLPYLWWWQKQAIFVITGIYLSIGHDSTKFDFSVPFCAKFYAHRKWELNGCSGALKTSFKLCLL